MQRISFSLPDDHADDGDCGVSVWSIDPKSAPTDSLTNDVESFGITPKPIDDPSLVGRVLTRRMLAELLQIKSHKVFLTKDDRGRPVLDLKRMPSAEAAELDFSYSHSENLFAVGAIQGGRIGLDIEVLRPETVLSLIPCRELSAVEQAWILALPESERPLAFYHCWTAKEALLKALGLGVSFGIEQIEVVRDADGKLRLAKITNSRQLAEGWSLEHRLLEFEELSALVAVVWAK